MCYWYVHKRCMTHTHTHMHTYTYTQHTCIHTHTHKHTHTHTHNTHVYTHTHTTHNIHVLAPSVWTFLVFCSEHTCIHCSRHSMSSQMSRNIPVCWDQDPDRNTFYCRECEGPSKQCVHSNTTTVYTQLQPLPYNVLHIFECIPNATSVRAQLTNSIQDKQEAIHHRQQYVNVWSTYMRV